jgi:hypothetical protein
MVDFFEGKKIVKAQIDEVTKEYGEIFLLRSYPDLEFCLSEAASYHNDSQAMLYTCSRKLGSSEKWLAFAKGTLAELKRNIIKIKVEKKDYIVGIAFRSRKQRGAKVEVEAYKATAVNESVACDECIARVLAEYGNVEILSYKWSKF